VAVVAAMAAPARAQEAPPEEQSLLFVQSASAGSLVPREGSPDSFTLSLEGLDEHALWFTDRPERQSGHVPTKGMLNVLDFEGAQGPPNAVLSIAGADPAKNMVALTLRDPKYDAEDQTIRYDATKLDDVSATQLASYASDVDESVRRRFGSAALFIDSARPDAGCTLTVSWAGTREQPLSVTRVQDYIPAFSKYASSLQPPAEIPYGEPWTTTSGVGLPPTSGFWCRGGTSFQGPDGQVIFVFFNNRWQLTGQNEWGCNAPPEYRCEITGNGPRTIFLTVNVRLSKIR
jgi:hypothetical protein